MSEVLLAAVGLSAVRAGDQGPLAVLDGVDLTLAAGEVVDITGPSGAGKTTLLRALARLLPHVHGHLALEGTDASAIPPQQWRTRVALVQQQAVIVGGTVRQNLLLPWTLKVRQGVAAPAEDALRSALDGMGLSDVALDRDAARLSVGQAARVALLRVVLAAPAVLLLDEPDANLDADSAAQVSAITARFAEAGGGVVRVHHHGADRLASRVMRLSGGTLSEVADGR